eukprot:TRINITY_DN9093_c0_g2_i4.p3 TRINITY_DN9093_c0_g2~~TRINITY_DN9093_c0_g2_i4.p3  ORF type:complete len:137 (-),score=13.21 TRINITY_DN9093_c0_g2_i4:1204-1614(-)
MHKVAVVANADVVVDKRAVVIKARHATIAGAAVLGAKRLADHAREAKVLRRQLIGLSKLDDGLVALRGLACHCAGVCGVGLDGAWMRGKQGSDAMCHNEAQKDTDTNKDMDMDSSATSRSDTDSYLVKRQFCHKQK